MKNCAFGMGCFGFLVLMAFPLVATASNVRVEAVEGRVLVGKPGEEAAAEVGQKLPFGTTLRTGAKSTARLAFPGGTEVRVRASSRVVLRPRDTKSGQKSGVSLFFGRVWSRIVKSVSGGESFEVRSANAVAGVRGTELEVGVGDDGSTRILVGRGRVGVTGDGAEGTVEIAAGYEVESGPRGRLGGRKRTSKDPDWEGWFSRRAKALQKRGSTVAKDLEQRLDRRRRKVRELLDRQSELRRVISGLERQKSRGAEVDEELQVALAKMERLTERLESMKARLQAGFGMFSHWGEIAEKGEVSGSPALLQMARDMERIAKGFADLFEEGTDLSEEGMDDMMKEMDQGPTLKPEKSAADELF